MIKHDTHWKNIGKCKPLKATSGTTMHNLMFKMKGYEQIYISDELLQRLSNPDYFSGSKL